MSRHFESLEKRACTDGDEFVPVERQAAQAGKALSSFVASSASGEFNDLPAHVWPDHAQREDDGAVSVAGVSLVDLAHEYGTPLYVVDEEDFRERCRRMAAAFGGGTHVHYASKAMLTRTIARWVAEEGLSLDVASLGELQIALAADFPAERITAHGNNKRPDFLELCVTSGVGHVVVDSPQEIGMLDEIAAKHKVTQDVLVRVKPGIEAHTHEFIATSHEDQKFGFSLASGDAKKFSLAAAAAPHLTFTGVHCHVGSQVFDAQGFTMAAQRLLALIAELKTILPADQAALVNLLDLGGGYGIAYTADQKPLDVEAIAQTLLEAVRTECTKLGIAVPDVLVEPGRAIAGPPTVTVYTVGTVKDVHVTDTTTRRYVSVDGGMSDNIRPALYQADYEGRVVGRFTRGAPIPTRLVGSHCESGDILISNAPWPDDVRPGDLVALAATGAYCWSMSSRYNMFFRPAVVSVRDGKASLMVRRETAEDVLRLEDNS